MRKPLSRDSLNSLILPAYLTLIVLASGCSGRGEVTSTPDDGGRDAPLGGTDVNVVIKFDGGYLPSGDGGCTAKITSCTAGSGLYCGIIGDGCGGNLNCGACPAGQACLGGVCSTGAAYDGGVVTSCTVTGGQYCGDIGDGLGGKLSCGPCTTPGWVCTAGICTADATVCTPKVCKVGDSQYCGTVGDGCGHALECGTCSAGLTCVNNQCVPTTCTALTCNPTGGQYCGGPIGDGCGGAMTCGVCATPGWTCQNNLCKGGAGCVPVTCGTGAGKYCGTIGDGCGGVLACGECLAGEVCKNNQCMPEVCSKLTCTPAGGQYCGGQVGDGCGGTLDCSQPCPAGWTCVNHLCVGDIACPRLTTCTNGTPFNYCGNVGDNCGGTLNCGNSCAAGQVCDTTIGLCKGDATCVPKTCTNDTIFNYCGTIGDGCGGTIACGNDCAAGQVCDTTTGLCKGGPDCVPVACVNGTPFNYCGEAGDGCGGNLLCGNDCAAGQVCGADGVCKGDGSCVPITCDTGTGFNYCGTIGDGCGGKLLCPTQCATGQACGLEGLCKGDATCVPKTCDTGTDFDYCGTIGDGCGGALRCSATCATSQVCDTATGLCKGDATCTPRTTCATSTEYNYCGIIGNGCGGSLDCGTTTCGQGKICDGNTGLCQGDSTCVRLASCSNGTTYNYCGVVGDGCGGSLTCSTDCGTGRVCDTTTGLCKGDSSCVPLTVCTNGTPFNYCGNIGDGCGGTLACPTTACGTGKICDTTNGLCRGDSTCVPTTSCSNGTAYDYCGRIGDGCGGSLNCPTTCAANQVCDTTTGLCKGDSSCVPRTVCTNDTDFNYCGVIGDGCGGSLDCGTNTCGAGKECDTTNRVCRGDVSCIPLSCTNTTTGAVQYCGGVIGDDCGGSLTCNGTCPAKTKCEDNVCVCDDGLRCQVATDCSPGSETTITGKVYDPAGANPLYNVMVYVPNAALPAISHGIPTGQTACDRCPTEPAAWAAAYGDPITAAVSTTDGTFTLTNAPNGTNIPLVFQIGKWRRQVTIPSVARCATTDVSAGDTAGSKFARLPRNQTDGVAGTVSLPRIAVAAGGAHPQYTSGIDWDSTERLQCLLSRIGVDSNEFSLPSQTGFIHLYSQSLDTDDCNSVSGGTYPDASGNLWDSQTHLNQYDMILLNCNGRIDQMDPNTNNSFISHPGAVDRMKAYVNAGGRVFAEHYHWAWFKAYSGYPSTFGDVATWHSNTGNIGSTTRDSLIDTSFQRGQDFASWLVNVQASSTLGHLTISSGVKYTAINQITPPSRRWIYENDQTTGNHTYYFSFDTPVEPAVTDKCGRVVYTALHVSDSVSVGYANDPSTSEGTVFPGCCADRAALSPQEKALEFMIFDLSSCISTGGIPTPIPPPPPPPAPPPPAPPPPAAAPPAAPSAPPPPAPAPPPPAAPPPPPPASPPPPAAPAAPPPPPAPAPPAPPPPATSPPAPPSPPVPPPPPPPPPVAAPPPPPAPPPGQVPPPPPPPPPPPQTYIP